jgi:hypothetical protein
VSIDRPHHRCSWTSSPPPNDCCAAIPKLASRTLRIVRASFAGSCSAIRSTTSTTGTARTAMSFSCSAYGAPCESAVRDSDAFSRTPSGRPTTAAARFTPTSGASGSALDAVTTYAARSSRSRAPTAAAPTCSVRSRTPARGTSSTSIRRSRGRSSAPSSPSCRSPCPPSRRSSSPQPSSHRHRRPSTLQPDPRRPRWPRSCRSRKSRRGALPAARVTLPVTIRVTVRNATRKTPMIPVIPTGLEPVTYALGIEESLLCRHMALYGVASFLDEEPSSEPWPIMARYVLRGS